MEQALLYVKIPGPVDLSVNKNHSQQLNLKGNKNSTQQLKLLKRPNRLQISNFNITTPNVFILRFFYFSGSGSSFICKQKHSLGLDVDGSNALSLLDF